MKRIMDVVVSLILLTILSPIILLVAVLIKAKMGSPVLFIQQRPGLHGQPFNLYKFRTMAEIKDGQGYVLEDEMRLTNLGSMLRRGSLDELPQLVNVLKGEMSLIGPRPLLMEYLPLYTEEQAKRHHVRPGITGWAQINGRNAITWEEKFKFDTWYAENHTIRLDMKIFLLTVLKIVKSEGINQQGHVTIEKFRGSKEVLRNENHPFG